MSTATASSGSSSSLSWRFPMRRMDKSSAKYTISVRIITMIKLSPPAYSYQLGGKYD